MYREKIAELRAAESKNVKTFTSGDGWFPHNGSKFWL
jgi:hypothetical protein